MTEKEQFILNIHRETLVDRLVQVLQESIFSGKRLPKSRISEVGVAKEFGISRVPAREALQRLEEMSLVRKTHLGREVVQFSREEFGQIFELKNVVEAYGAMQGSLNASPQEIENVEAILAEMKEAIAQNDITRFQELSHAFHDALVFCCNNPKVIESFVSLARRVRWATPISIEDPATSPVGLPGTPGDLRCLP